MKSSKGRLFMEISTADFIQFSSDAARFSFLEWRLGTALSIAYFYSFLKFYNFLRSKVLLCLAVCELPNAFSFYL